MQDFNNLISVCNRYKLGEFDIKEFQSRITTSAIPENISKEFMDSLAFYHNELERIIFCEDPALREEKALVIADELIEAIQKEQDFAAIGEEYAKKAEYNINEILKEVPFDDNDDI